MTDREITMVVLLGWVAWELGLVQWFYGRVHTETVSLCTSTPVLVATRRPGQIPKPKDSRRNPFRREGPHVTYAPNARVISPQCDPKITPPRLSERPVYRPVGRAPTGGSRIRKSAQ